MIDALAEYRDSTLGCTRCPLAATRTQVVFGSGNPHAELMFVGEAPGFHEDKQGVPFVGQAGKLLDTLLAGIGLSRADVFVAKFPSVATSVGRISSIWRKRCDSQASISSGCGSRFPGGRHFRVFET